MDVSAGPDAAAEDADEDGRELPPLASELGAAVGETWPCCEGAGAVDCTDPTGELGPVGPDATGTAGSGTAGTGAATGGVGNTGAVGGAR